MWADILPGARALINAFEANPRADPPPVPQASLHLAPASGTFAPALRAILGRRTSTGISEGTLCAFALMSGHGEPLATRALAALARTNAEGDALLLARIGRRLGQPRPGDLVSSVFGDEACGISDGAIRLRNIILDVARDLFIRDSNRSFGAAPFAHPGLTSLPYRRPGGQAKGVAGRYQSWRGLLSPQQLAATSHSSNQVRRSSPIKQSFSDPKWSRRRWSNVWRR